MEQEMKKPFKTVTTEYFEELQETPVGMMERRVRVVTTTNQWVGSDKDPVIAVTFEYL
jgi:phosphoglucomutase